MDPKTRIKLVNLILDIAHERLEEMVLNLNHDQLRIVSENECIYTISLKCMTID